MAFSNCNWNMTKQVFSLFALSLSAIIAALHREISDAKCFVGQKTLLSERYFITSVKAILVCNETRPNLIKLFWLSITLLQIFKAFWLALQSHVTILPLSDWIKIQRGVMLLQNKFYKIGSR